MTGADPSTDPASLETEGSLILVVDDDRMIRRMTRATLEGAGHRVIEAEDGDQGLIAIGRDRPDLVLLDVEMPGRDGISLCASLRAQPATARIPVIIMTSAAAASEIQRAYEAGASDFISKPFNPRVLRDRVRFMLRATLAVNELRRSERNFAMAQRVARVGNWILDLQTGAIRVSGEAARILQLRANEPPTSLEALHAHLPAAARRQVLEAIGRLAGGGEGFDLEYPVERPGRTPLMVREHAERFTDPSGDEHSIVGAILDVTDLASAQAHIRKLAYSDSVTGLANRPCFNEAMADQIANGEKFGVLFIDLDRFKRINDSLGHAVGDDLLRVVAERLSGALRSRGTGADNTLLARLGGDEFAVLLADVSQEDSAIAIANRLSAALAEPFRVGPYDLVVTASVGVALYPRDGEDTDSLLRSADSAMYLVKDAGGNSVREFRGGCLQQVQDRLWLEASLLRAIEGEEFEVYFQPKVDVETLAFVGSEALIRWRHPEKGLILPAGFIPIAEELGLIVPIGAWVLQHACMRQRALLDAGLQPGPVAVNLSARQFALRDLPTLVQQALDAAHLPPELLELEVTESLVMRDVDAAVRTMHRLKELGVGLSIDDFGTGHASLSYLQRFPVDTLKIDRSFIRCVDEQHRDAVIASMVIALGKALGLTIVAEGVETESQLDFLRRNGCETMQGYLVSRPVPYARYAELLMEQGRRSA